MTNYVIGFAEQFWTLWIAEKEPVYLIGKDGNNYLTGYNTKYSYVKNISKDQGIAKVAYPEAEIDPELRGITTRTHVALAKEDLCPQIMKFGVHYAESIDVLVESDLDYILWLIKDRPNTPNAQYAKKHKVVITHFKKIEKAEEKRKLQLVKRLDEITQKGCVTFEAQKNLSIFYSIESDRDYGYLAVTTEDGIIINLIFKPSDIQVYNYQGREYALPVINGKPKRIKGKQLKITFDYVDKIENVEMAKNQFIVTSIEFLK